MCIICYKPQGVAFPPKKEIKRMFNSNPDGCGYMFADGDAVTIKKGFMSFRDLWSALKEDRRQELPFVFHFRITTHGGTCKELCHPFPLTDNTTTLYRTALSYPVGVAHNGIISLTSYATTSSDTALYIQNYMSRLLSSGIERWKLDMIEASINGSRMAILTAGGDCYLLGKFTKDSGRYYSNNSYKDTPKTTYKYTTPYNYLDYVTPVCDDVDDCADCRYYTTCYGVPK